jgi:hypothetical protein
MLGSVSVYSLSDAFALSRIVRKHSLKEKANGPSIFRHRLTNFIIDTTEFGWDFISEDNT